MLLHLNKAIMFMLMTITYMSSSHKMETCIHKKNNVIARKMKMWTADIVNVVELIYSFDTVKCVDNGGGTLDGLAAYIGYFFGVDIKNCSNTYIDMKRRKGESRTYFLDKLSRELNQRMDKDDQRAAKRSK